MSAPTFTFSVFSSPFPLKSLRLQHNILIVHTDMLVTPITPATIRILTIRIGVKKNEHDRSDKKMISRY